MADDVAEQTPADPPAGPADPGGRRWRSLGVPGRLLLGVAGILLVATAAYGIDWFTAAGKIPRGVTVGGIAVGGLTEDQAADLLAREFEPRLAAPVRLQAGDVPVEVSASEAGLGLDWASTLEQAGDQPANPLARLASLFSDREIGYVSSVDDGRLDAAMEGVRAQVDREPVEGGVVFDGPTPVPVLPLPGRALDVPAARQLVAANWLGGQVIELPTAITPVTVSEANVREALRAVAEPAAAAELRVRGDNGAVATLPRQELGRVVVFRPDGRGGLAADFHREVAVEVLAPQLARTEATARDATVSLAGAAPQVVPSREGRAVNWERTLEDFDALMVAPADRVVDAVYEVVAPGFTTDQAARLGIREVVSEFTTGGFTVNSGHNIRQVAAEVNGAVVKPGETFSLNGYTGPRGYPQGYIDSGIILNGRPGMAVGGGVSQFATTLYNAAYFAGMEDVEHQEHSYFIDRYPAGREATVFAGSIDLRFRNNTGSGVLIQAFGDSSTVTVRFWGTKTVEVESVNGGRWGYTSPQTVTLPAGPGCLPSGGSQGFTTSDTRIVRVAATGAEVSRETRTVTYTPQPVVICR